MRLIDADAYAAELWKLRANYQMLDDTHTADKIMHGIFRAEQALKEQPTVAASPWHRVEEPPKEDGKYVALNVKANWWYEASYENGVWKAVDLFNQRWVLIHPTHWMPIEPPKEEE